MQPKAGRNWLVHTVHFHLSLKHGIFYDFGLFSNPRIRTRPGGVWRIDAILFGRGLFWGQIFGLSKPFLDQRPSWQVSLTLKVSFGHIFGYCPVILMSKKFFEKFRKKYFYVKLSYEATARHDFTEKKTVGVVVTWWPRSGSGILDLKVGPVCYPSGMRL